MTNEYGLDVSYIETNLRQILIGIARYTPAEMARALGRLAVVASAADARSVIDREATPEHSPEPFAWATFDGEGSYDLRLYECNESYRDEWIAANGQRYADWVVPLYDVEPNARSLLEGGKQ